MKNNIPVSICLLTYNRANLLPMTIDSLLDQSFQEFELIISDDCSTDKTEEICKDYSRKDPRIRYIRNPHNLGMPGNLNAALQYSNGKYIADLHDGDIYNSRLIEKWYDALEMFPTAGFVFNNYRSVHKGREIIYREDYPPLLSGHVLGLSLLSKWSSCVHGTVMVRREVYEKLGWFDPQFGNFSDIDMWLRIAHDYDVAYINEPLIDLMPKDSTRFYGFVHWQVLFWILGIHTLNLRRYRLIMPDEVNKLARMYSHRRRNYLLYNMLLCIKHKRFDRVQEGLAIWRDSDDQWLKLIGVIFSNSSSLPEWYQDQPYWQMAQL